MTDLYRVLGVSRRATKAEIRSAYRILARKNHPDVSSSSTANARFAQISEAYRILSNPKLRERYDRGEPIYRRNTFYASRDAEIVACQRKFDQVVDEMMASQRRETDARSHAVFVVVTLFMSVFYVAFAKPTIIQELNLVGRVLVVAIALYGGWYLVRNLSVVLARYTYEGSSRLVSLFREELPKHGLISRQAGLTLIISGYLVSIGLGIILSRVTRLHYGPMMSPSMLLGVFIYPPIAVLIIGGFRRIGKLLDQV
jgi:hypothetical protein